jgi:hypothetical protein
MKTIIVSMARSKTKGGMQAYKLRVNVMAAYSANSR